MGRRVRERGLELALRQIERVRLQGTIAAFRLPARCLSLLIIVGDILRPLLRRGERGLVDDQEIVLAEMVEQGRQPILEQGQPVFHAREPTPFADRFVKRVLRGVGAEHFAVAGAEAFDAVFVQQSLAGGQEQMPLEPPSRQLRVGIEAAQAFQFVTEEIEPQCLVHSAREDVNDRAADGVFALVDDRVGARIALALEQGGKAVAPDLHPRREFAHAFADAEGWEDALQNRIGGRDQQLRTRLSRLQAMQCSEATGAD